MYAELKENHPHGTREYPFCEYHMRYWPHAFQIPVHWHDEVEIIYVRKGPLMVEIDDALAQTPSCSTRRTTPTKS